MDDINKWECILYIPSENTADYQAAPQWKEFFFIEASGVEDVIGDDQNALTAPIEIYNLAGMKVGDSIKNLPPGIYIKRQCNKSEKILVR